MSAGFSQSHYATLGLSRDDFSEAALKKTYRALAMRWHPDRNRGNEEAAAEKFKAVQEAFTVLSDPNARAEYDRELIHQRRVAAAQSRPQYRRPQPTASPSAPPQPTAPRTASSAATGSPAAAAPKTPAQPAAPRWEDLRRGADVPRAPAAAAPAPPRESATSRGSSHEASSSRRRAADAEAVRSAAPVEEWPGLEAALAQSEREAREAAQRDEQSAVAEALAAERREAAEIEEALRLVEEATRRERAEFEEALRAVAVAEGGIEVHHGSAHATPPTVPAVGRTSTSDPFPAVSVPLYHEGGGSPGYHDGSTGSTRGGSTGSSSLRAATPSESAESQLATLMELGYHAELVAPYCDGVSSIEEILEQLSLDMPDDGAEPREEAPPVSRRGSRRGWGLARRFLGTA